MRELDNAETYIERGEDALTRGDFGGALSAAIHALRNFRKARIRMEVH